MTKKKIAHAINGGNPSAPESWDVPATIARTAALSAERNKIREQNLPALVARARALAADLAYVADMLEHELGAPEVRRANGQWVDRIHLLTVNQATLDGQRWLLLIGVIRGAASESKHPSGYYTPPRTPAGHVHAQLRSYASQDRDFVARIDVASVVAILPLWLTRRKAGGRGTRVRMWPAILAIGVKAGLRQVDEETLKSIWKQGSKDLLEHERA